MDGGTLMNERRARQQANEALAALGRTYHNGLPIAEIDQILTNAGLREMEDGIYCGDNGRTIEQVGDRTWLSLSWHRMEESRRFEIVAYVS
jgi:hypothetical protein